MQQTLSNEQQRLQSRLHADHNGFLTTTRLRLARLASARGVEPHAIEDVVQETFLEAWDHLDRLSDPSGFHAWIDEICRNMCRRAARRQMTELRRNPSLSQPSASGSDENETEAVDLLGADTPDPLEALNREDLTHLLDRALGLVPRATRQLMEMSYLLELPHAEVAARLGLSRGTLDVRLHRARRLLREIFHGPLRQDAEAFGLPLETTLTDGWRPTRVWCPLCACHRLEGWFLTAKAGDAPNVHIRCPSCWQRYNQDTVHSMGLVRLAGAHSFRPAWKHTMQGLADRVLRALEQGQHPCLHCGQPAFVRVTGSDPAAIITPEDGTGRAGPYAWWIQLHCLWCGTTFDGTGVLPSIDQLVAWGEPRVRHFLLEHPRSKSEPATVIEHAGQAAFLVYVADMASSERITVVAHRQTLRILTIDSTGTC